MTELFNDIDSYKYKTVIETRFADFDMMGHVNNSVYFTYMEIARVKYWKHAINWDWKKTGVVIGQAALKYIVPIFPEDQIDLEYLLVKKKDGKEIVCSKGMTACVAYDNHKKQATPIPDRERNKMILFEQLVSAELNPEV
jgi:acyl-CoA thioester hydrolase